MKRGLEAPMPGLPPASTTGTKTTALIQPVSLSSHVFDGPAIPVAQAEGIATSPLGHVSVEHSGVRDRMPVPRCLSRAGGLPAGAHGVDAARRGSAETRPCAW